MADEWGPWIEHDGRGCPLAVGQVPEVRWSDGTLAQYPIDEETISPPPGMTTPWHFAHWHPRTLLTHYFVEAYRIRKPRGMVAPESLLADLPESVDA